MIATSGLVSRIQACDFSNPENTRFQYGSSVLPLSSAAPMAGTCDEPTPAMILATAHFRFADDLDLDFDLLEFDLAGLLLPDLVRLPSTERPPASIIAVYSCCEEPVMSAARCWNEWPSVAPSLAVK